LMCQEITFVRHFVQFTFEQRHVDVLLIVGLNARAGLLFRRQGQQLSIEQRLKNKKAFVDVTKPLFVDRQRAIDSLEQFIILRLVTVFDHQFSNGAFTVFVGLKTFFQRMILMQNQAEIRIRLVQFRFEIPKTNERNDPEGSRPTANILNMDFAFVVLSLKEFVFLKESRDFAL
jgi:hypothetical protein